MFGTNWWRKQRDNKARRRRANSLGSGGLLCEELEPRIMLKIELGTLDPGRLYLPNQTFRGSFTSTGETKYSFTVPDAFVEVYLSQELSEAFLPVLVMSIEGVGSTLGQLIAHPKLLFAHLAAGTYELDIDNPATLDQTNTLVINVDLAPPNLPTGDLATTSVFADAGRDLGTLSADSATSVKDFVGGLNNDDDPVEFSDLADTYFFDIPARGTVSATLDQLVADAAGGVVSQSITLYRDVNQDGVFTSDEALATRSGVTPGTSGSTSASLNAGHYGVVVRPLVIDDPLVVGAINGGSNYRLRLSYAPPDNGGNMLATPTTISNLLAPTVDYLSATDATDVYQLNTGAGGPFVFDATVGGLLPGSDNLVQLINDANGNGQLDGTELLATAETFNGSPVELGASINAGTYLIRLTRVAGEGPYALTLNLRNTDQGGPASFPTNINFSTSLLGQKEIIDTVSATDPEDVFRFTLERSATLSASFPATAVNTNADMQFIFDANNDNVFNGGDQLIVSSTHTSNAGESILASAAAGQYFLRILRVAGTPLYDLKVNADYAGNTTTSARTMAFSDDTIEFLGPGDRTDYYRIKVAGPVQLNIFPSFLGDKVNLIVGPDSNGNGAVDTSEALLSKPLPLGSFDQETVNLPAAGTYFVGMIFAGAVGTNYDIEFLSAPIDNAGNTLAAARNLGELGNTQTVSDFVGDGSIDATDDADDFYSFTLGSTGPYVFVGQVPFVAPGASLSMQLIRDVNGNGKVDLSSHEVIGSTTNAIGSPVPPLVATLKDPGTYYVHILRNVGEAAYTATFAAISTDTAGNSEVATARFLGSFGAGTSTLTSPTEFVGRIDRDDLYLVNLANPGEISAKLTGATPTAFIDIVPAPSPTFSSNPSPTDFNSIWSSTPDLQKASTSSTQTGGDVIQGLVAASGNYLIRVHSEADTTYSLSVTYAPESPFASTGPVILPAPSSLPTSGVIIQAEDFDQGGEGVAYHDTTTGNQGGAYRSTDVDVFANPGGGFAVDNGSSTEFLNYTFFAQGNGQFDIDVSCGAAVFGGIPHLEIDGVSVGALTVPVTGSNSTFATVTAQNILITQGPHVLRLAIDTRSVTPGSAGGFDSLTIRRSQGSIGTFVLTPQHSTASSDGRVTLAVAWTVPGKSWRDLTTIDVRLRDESGALVWLRFDEASNTVSLYNQHSGKFGPAKKIGSKGALSDGDVAIDLSDASVSAAGPNSPTVTLTVSMRFLGTKDHHFSVELAASNDAGFVGDFIQAGTLDVLRSHCR